MTQLPRQVSVRCHDSGHIYNYSLSEPDATLRDNMEFPAQSLLREMSLCLMQVKFHDQHVSSSTPDPPPLSHLSFIPLTPLLPSHSSPPPLSLIPSPTHTHLPPLPLSVITLHGSRSLFMVLAHSPLPLSSYTLSPCLSQSSPFSTTLHLSHSSPLPLFSPTTLYPQTQPYATPLPVLHCITQCSLPCIPTNLLTTAHTYSHLLLSLAEPYHTSTLPFT